jgi:uncharacterized membrane protein YgaE (UPF0421/DUF939 family)
MWSHHSGRGRAFVFAVVLAFAVTVTVTVAGAASAAGATPATLGQDAEAFDANETEGTIDRVRYQLLGVAAITGALLVGYIWHTDPQRRLRVAHRRREDREREAVAALEDEFVLPADADVEADAELDDH